MSPFISKYSIYTDQEGIIEFDTDRLDRLPLNRELPPNAIAYDDSSDAFTGGPGYNQNYEDFALEIDNFLANAYMINSTGTKQWKIDNRPLLSWLPINWNRFKKTANWFLSDNELQQTGLADAKSHEWNWHTDDWNSEALARLQSKQTFKGLVRLCSCGEAMCGSDYGIFENGVIQLLIRCGGGEIRYIELFPASITT